MNSNFVVLEIFIRIITAQFDVFICTFPFHDCKNRHRLHTKTCRRSAIKYYDMCFQIAIDGMARVLCMSELIDKDPAKATSSSHAGRSSTARPEHHSHPRPQSKDRRSTQRNQSEPSYGSCIQPSPVPTDAAGLVDRSPVHCPVNPALEADVRDIRRLLKTYVTRLETKDAAARTAKEWRIVARVLDRLFFFCYVGIIIVSMIVIFYSSGSHAHSTELPADD